MINPDIHMHLLTLGYAYRHYEEEYWDDGDAENGPHLSGHPSFDEYRSDDDYIIIDAKGNFVHREPRDLEFEKFMDQQEKLHGGQP